MSFDMGNEKKQFSSFTKSSLEIIALGLGYHSVSKISFDQLVEIAVKAEVKKATRIFEALEN